MGFVKIQSMLSKELKHPYISAYTYVLSSPISMSLQSELLMRVSFKPRNLSIILEQLGKSCAPTNKAYQRYLFLMLICKMIKVECRYANDEP